MAQCAHEVVSFGEFTDDGMRVVGIDGTQNRFKEAMGAA